MKDHMQAGDWDDHYRKHGRQGPSREPGGVLVAEIGGEAPGRALEVGCGSGTDAIWLAAQGWQVTAVDVSQAALERAATAADGAGVTVDWVCADMTTVPPAVGEYDLVSVQYPALRRSPDDEVIRSLLDAVAPDGTILVVGHGPESHEYARAHGFEPADYIEPADVAARLDESWSIEVNETRPRSTAPRPDSPFRQDVVLRARRRPIR